MKLNEEQFKEVYEILREKLLVMRAGSEGMVNITPGNERYFPEKNKIVLGMPLASSRTNLTLKEKPKAINVIVGKKQFKSFSLQPLYENKKIAALDVNSEKQKSLIQKYKVKDEQSYIPVLKTFYIHLPYYSNCLNYGEVITRMTLELFDQFLSKERVKVEEAFADEHYSSAFKSKIGNKLTFNKSHEQYIEKKYFDFLKSFDAFEITSCEEFPLISNYKGFENFDERLNYASYTVSFWKFPIAEKPNYKSQKVSTAESLAICLKRAVCNKAHIKMNEKAVNSNLPLISEGAGKGDN